MTIIKTPTSPPIGEIIFDSPETLNLIEENTFELIEKALDSFELDEEIKVVLIRANCGISRKSKLKVFCAGVNLKTYDKKFKLIEENPEEFREKLISNREFLTRIEQFPKPVVMAVDGLAIGGGFELALACDVILATHSASFCLNEVNIGLIPGYGGIHRLMRLVGKNRAYDIIATGRKISAEEAQSLGICTKISKDEEIMEYCTSLASKSPLALKLIKNTIYCGDEVSNFIQAASSQQARKAISEKF